MASTADGTRRGGELLSLIQRRLRIGVGGLMVVILLVSLWLGDRVGRARERRLAVAAVAAAGGEVHYADEFTNRPIPAPPNAPWWKPQWGGLVLERGPWKPNWWRRHLGPEYFREVAYVTLFDFGRKGRDRPPVDGVLRALGGQSGIRTLKLCGDAATDAGLAAMANLTRLEEFYLARGAGITDAGLAHLGRLPRLKVVIIDQSSLTDESLRHLADLPDLEYLSLRGRRFTDRGLEHLARARRLRFLKLGSEESALGDAGLRYVEALPNLRYLNLENSRVSDEARVRIDRVRPDIQFIPFRLE